MNEPVVNIPSCFGENEKILLLYNFNQGQKGVKVNYLEKYGIFCRPFDFCVSICIEAL